MAFFPPIPLIRKKRILYLLRKSNATSKENAKSLDEIGLLFPYAFSMITYRMIEKGDIVKTEDGKYYIKQK